MKVAWTTSGGTSCAPIEMGAAAQPSWTGIVRFANPLDYPIEIAYAAPDSAQAGGLTVEPHATKDKKVGAAKIRWYAFPSDAGDDPLPVDQGTVRSHCSPALVGGRPAALRSARVDQPPAAVDDAAPTTVGNQVTLDYYDDAHVQVLANDSDDSPGGLAVCWVDVPAGVGLSALIEPWWADSDRARSDSPDRYIDLNASAATAGTYTLTYYACDKHRMTSGTLTVTVRDFPPVKVRRVHGHPGTLRFVNDGYRNVDIQYFQTGHHSEEFHLRVPGHGHRRLHVSYDDLTYFADTKIGPLGSGRVKNLYPN